MKTKYFYPKMLLNKCAGLLVCAALLGNIASANIAIPKPPSLLSRHAINANDTGESPYINELWDQYQERNQVGDYWLEISDPDTPFENLIITITSSNEEVIPSSNLIYSPNILTISSGSTLGESLITVSATDPEGNTAVRSFLMVVYNYDPYVWLWPEYINLQCIGDPVDEIYLEYGDFGASNEELTVEFTSSNEEILPVSQLNFEITPWGGVFYPELNPGAGGFVEITATITDLDGASQVSSFIIDVPEDITPPNISISADTLTFVLEEGVCEITPDWSELINVAEHETFGNDASYITNAHFGTFYAAANTTYVTEFGVDGNIGADGNGTVEHGMEVITSASGNVYHLYWQTQAATWYDPGIHKMIFVDPLQNNVSVLSDEYADDDTFIINGITGESSFFYFLFGGRDSEGGVPHIFNAEERLQIAQAMADNVLDAVRVSNEASFSYNLENIDALVASTVNSLREGILNTPLFYEINMDYGTDGADNPVNRKDGGYDMYDYGNFIVTNFSNLYRDYDFWNWDEGNEPLGIAYTNGVVFYTGETQEEESTSQLVQITDDGCDISVSRSHEVGQSFGPGMHTVAYTATDAAGNVSEASFVIHVIDEFAPTAVAEDLNLTLSQGEQFEIVGAFVGGGSFDNCEIVSYETSINQVTCENAGSNVVILTVSDAYGNEASTSFTVTVQCEIFGCMDPLACNYNPEANLSDASCQFNDMGYDCEGNCIGVPVSPEVYIENVWLVNGSECGAEGYLIGAIQPLNGLFYDFIPVPGGSGGQGSYSFNECGVIFDGILFMAWESESQLSGSIDGICYVMTPAVLGCTDELAANFNPEANFDDASCEYAVIPENDSREAAILVEQKKYPNCIAIEGSLVNASVSEESFVEAPEGCGEDVWYKFVAYAPAARIDVNSSSENIALELQDEAGESLITFENVSESNQEIIVLDGLNVGQTYYIAIRNWSESNEVTFSACFQLLAASTLSNGPIYSGLCDRFKVENTGADIYSVVVSDEMGSTSANAFNHWVPLHTVPGLEHDHSYAVEVTTTYILEDAAGNPITIDVYGQELVEVYVNPIADLDVREMDLCPRTKRLNSVIATGALPCGVQGLEWEFTQVDEFDQPIAEPLYALGNGRSRFFRVNNIPDVEPGNRYAVRIRVVYLDGEFGEWGDDYQYICIFNNPQQAMVLPGNARATESEFFSEGVSLYPNPNNGSDVNISVTGITANELVVTVYDATARLIAKHYLYDIDQYYSSQIQFEQTLNDGVYLLNFEYDGKIITKRLVVAN